MILLTMCVTLSARYKLPILREICICISNLNIYMRSFKKKKKKLILHQSVMHQKNLLLFMLSVPQLEDISQARFLIFVLFIFVFFRISVLFYSFKVVKIKESLPAYPPDVINFLLIP